MKTSLLAALLATVLPLSAATDDGFESFGEYEIRSQMKITGNGKVVQVPIKPLKLTVTSDGVTIRVSSAGKSDAWSTFKIYRSDGIGRQKTTGGPLEVVPGVQATSDHRGVHKHLRLTRDTLTLTVFPGVSDQTVVTHAVLAPSPTDEPAADSKKGSPAP
ncbi:hypothetical protein OKA04_06970 [Luteolibacter flavescens]|uniref:Uncharacterized protein n=1 Tax=Luteolibacter flavescens TaxID=1859460 RepID=A0ABT3FLY5_9BACT|nr:hypothetical protein [Luteolibacter flavescens]MCW1884467.1 hypothetical protein [Luteolibacter flavescens]